MNTKAKNILYFAILGGVGPLLALIGPKINIKTITDFVGTLLWPTWLAMWFVLGKGKDHANLIIFATIISNMVVFAGIGWTYGKLQFKKKTFNYISLALIYALTYAIIFVALLQVL